MSLRIDGIKDVERLLTGEHESQNKIFVPVTSAIGEDSGKGREDGDEWINSDGSVWEQTKYGPRKKAGSVRQIGEIWSDDNGIQWEQKDGYKVRLGTEWQQHLRSVLREFPNCQKEECTCTLPKKLDEKMRRLKGMCFDCVIGMEHKIKIAGKWEEYELQCMYENALAWLREAEADKEVIADELSRLEFTNSLGTVEKWDTSITKEEMLSKIESEFQAFKNEFLLDVQSRLKKFGDGDAQNASKETEEAELNNS